MKKRETAKPYFIHEYNDNYFTGCVVRKSENDIKVALNKSDIDASKDSKLYVNMLVVKNPIERYDSKVFIKRGKENELFLKKDDFVCTHKDNSYKIDPELSINIRKYTFVGYTDMCAGSNHNRNLNMSILVDRNIQISVTGRYTYDEGNFNSYDDLYYDDLSNTYYEMLKKKKSELHKNELLKLLNKVEDAIRDAYDGGYNDVYDEEHGTDDNEYFDLDRIISYTKEDIENYIKSIIE